MERTICPICKGLGVKLGGAIRDAAGGVMDAVDDEECQYCGGTGIQRPIKVKRQYWMVHYDDRSAAAWTSEEYAENRASVAGVGVVAFTGPHEIEYTEGDGLWRILPRKA